MISLKVRVLNCANMESLNVSLDRNRKKKKQKCVSIKCIGSVRNWLRSATDKDHSMTVYAFWVPLVYKICLDDS